MNLSVKLILLMAISICFSCKSNADTKTKSPVTKQIDVNDEYWQNLQSKTGLNAQDVAELKPILKKFNKQKKTLQKKKKWAGVKNKKNRAKHTQSRSNAIKKKLGPAKAKQYFNFTQKKEQADRQPK